MTTLRDEVFSLDWTKGPEDDLLRLISRLDERFFPTAQDRLKVYLQVYESAQSGKFTEVSEQNVVQLLNLCRGIEDSPSPNDPSAALTICEEIIYSLGQGEKWFFYEIDYVPLFMRKLRGTDLPPIPEGYVTVERAMKIKNVSSRTCLDMIRSGRLSGGMYKDKVWAINPDERFDYWITSPDDPFVQYRRVLTGVELIESGVKNNLWERVDQEERIVPKYGLLSNQPTRLYLNNLTEDYDELLTVLDRLWEEREKLLTE